LICPSSGVVVIKKYPTLGVVGKRYYYPPRPKRLLILGIGISWSQ